MYVVQVVQGVHACVRPRTTVCSSPPAVGGRSRHFSQCGSTREGSTAGIIYVQPQALIGGATSSSGTTQHAVPAAPYCGTALAATESFSHAPNLGRTAGMLSKMLKPLAKPVMVLNPGRSGITARASYVAVDSKQVVIYLPDGSTMTSIGHQRSGHPVPPAAAATAAPAAAKLPLAMFPSATQVVQHRPAQARSLQPLRPPYKADSGQLLQVAVARSGQLMTSPSSSSSSTLQLRPAAAPPAAWRTAAPGSAVKSSAADAAAAADCTAQIAGPAWGSIVQLGGTMYVMPEVQRAAWQEGSSWNSSSSSTFWASSSSSSSNTWGSFASGTVSSGSAEGQSLPRPQQQPTGGNNSTFGRSAGSTGAGGAAGGSSTGRPGVSGGSSASRAAAAGVASLPAASVRIARLGVALMGLAAAASLAAIYREEASHDHAPADAGSSSSSRDAGISNNAAAAAALAMHKTAATQAAAGDGATATAGSRHGPGGSSTGSAVAAVDAGGADSPGFHEWMVQRLKGTIAKFDAEQDMLRAELAMLQALGSSKGAGIRGSVGAAWGAARSAAAAAGAAGADAPTGGAWGRIRRWFGSSSSAAAKASRQQQSMEQHGTAAPPSAVPDALTSAGIAARTAEIKEQIESLDVLKAALSGELDDQQQQQQRQQVQQLTQQYAVLTDSH